MLKQLCGITDCSAIDRATEVGIHAIEAWGAAPGSVHNGRGLLAKMVALSTLRGVLLREAGDEGEDGAGANGRRADDDDVQEALRHYAVPRMCELKDGECGTWVD